MARTCTPRDIEDLARDLAGRSEECARRAAINRAYYAAFHAILPVASWVPGNDDEKGAQGALAHRELPRRLRDWRFLPLELARLRSLAKKAKVAAGELSAAIAVRELADYSLDDAVDDSMVQLQLERMKVVLDFADEAQAEYERLCA
jgi:hypothetical protein